MAITTIKSTYSLDVETVRALENIARRWKVSKSEALRRAIRAAAGEDSRETNDAVVALDKLQRSMNLSAAKARAWSRRARTQRQTSSVRSELRGG